MANGLSQYSDIWGQDFGDLVDAISADLPMDVENLLVGKINSLFYDVNTFTNNINQQVALMTSNGLSKEAINDVLRADMQGGGRLFGQLQNNTKEQLSGAINQSSRLGQNSEYTENDKFIWVTVAGHKVCMDCAGRAGQVMTYGEWESEGLPGTGWSVCKGFCYCIIDPIGRMGKNVKAPVDPELNSKKAINAVNEKAAVKLKGKELKLYNKVLKLDSKAAKEMLMRKGMTSDEARRYMAIQRAKRASVGKDTKDLYFRNGVYARDSAILHNRIARNVTQNGQIAKAGTNPDLLMTGGYPGSGKSTTLDKVFKGWQNKYVHVDSDSIKQALALFDDVELTWNAALYHEEADDVLKLIFQKSFNENRHLLFDGTMKTGSKMVDFVEWYSKSGNYNPTAVLVDLPMEEALIRAIGRGLGDTGLNGRFVDPTYMLSHYAEVSGAEFSLNNQTYNRLKEKFEDIMSYVKYSNDVPYGDAPISIEEFFLP